MFAFWVKNYGFSVTCFSRWNDPHCWLAVKKGLRSGMSWNGFPLTMLSATESLHKEEEANKGVFTPEHSFCFSSYVNFGKSLKIYHLTYLCWVIIPARLFGCEHMWEWRNHVESCKGRSKYILVIKLYMWCPFWTLMLHTNIHWCS